MGLNLKHSDLIFIDTAPFIYFFEKHLLYFPHMIRLFDLVYERQAQIITSMITFIEIASYPMAQGHIKLIRKYRDYFTRGENISLIPIDLIIAEETTRVRAKYKLKTPDAIQIGTAISHGADYIITNDKGWKALDAPVPEVLMVEEI
ncbi:MAG: PIN domain-containing protein [Desulfobacterales bacterium]|jgi:predicted nucleic acid-binding protein